MAKSGTDGAWLHLGFSDREGEPITEREQQRLVKHRLAILEHAEEVAGNVAQTCRHYGISRQTFYKWLRRCEEQGLEGLRDMSRRPHNSPNATSAEVVGKIMYLRQHYHFGPHKIAMYLQRYHDITNAGGVRPAPQTRWARHLSLHEREEISRSVARGESFRVIASRLGRAPSTVSRELARNGGRHRYRAHRADRAAWQREQGFVFVHLEVVVRQTQEGSTIGFSNTGPHKTIAAGEEHLGADNGMR